MSSKQRRRPRASVAGRADDGSAADRGSTATSEATSPTTARDRSSDTPAAMSVAMVTRVPPSSSSAPVLTASSTATVIASSPALNTAAGRCAGKTPSCCPRSRTAVIASRAGASTSATRSAPRSRLASARSRRYRSPAGHIENMRWASTRSADCACVRSAQAATADRSVSEASSARASRSAARPGKCPNRVRRTTPAARASSSSVTSGFRPSSRRAVARMRARFARELRRNGSRTTGLDTETSMDHAERDGYGGAETPASSHEAPSPHQES